MTENHTAKIKTRDELRSIVKEFQADGQRVGYTSGNFDLLHPGHVEYLEIAREYCERLVVGVNSDASVRSYKGPRRPIVPAADRAAVVAGLQCVDFVFIFDESNNNENVSLLTPDVYLKAGDYDKSELTSAPLVESYGGSVELIPFKSGYSSSAVIEGVLRAFDLAHTATLEIPPYERKPAVFVDRDGTINENVDYLHEPKQFQLIPGAIEALKNLEQAGYRIVVITNQSGIGLGYYAKEDFYRVNRELLKAAGKAGLGIARVYFCPHSKADNCNCRKPKTGLVDRGVAELNIDISGSYVIGDMTADLLLGKNVGCHTVLVETGYGGKDGIHEVEADYKAKDLLAASQIILSNNN